MYEQQNFSNTMCKFGTEALCRRYTSITYASVITYTLYYYRQRESDAWSMHQSFSNTGHRYGACQHKRILCDN